jgi:hypothetical protein
MVKSMIYRKKKVEKRINSKEPEENNSVNAWEIIKENLATINYTCEFIKKSLSNLKINTNMIKEHYKSQTTKEKTTINNTNAHLRNTTNNLKKARKSFDSAKRSLNVNDAKKLPGLPLKLPN